MPRQLEGLRHGGALLGPRVLIEHPGCPLICLCLLPLCKLLQLQVALQASHNHGALHTYVAVQRGTVQYIAMRCMLLQL